VEERLFARRRTLFSDLSVVFMDTCQRRRENASARRSKDEAGREAPARAFWRFDRMAQGYRFVLPM
jgi:hypothetical protein